MLVYPKDDHRAATYTCLNFRCPTSTRLSTPSLLGGCRFLRYEDMPQDERGIMRESGPPIAWFTDPAGNVISVLQESPGPGES